ncbi:MAG: hypothetical protein ACRCVT_15675 [Leadbetterella sp.]
MPKKLKLNTNLPKVHKDLQGLDVKINTFGEIQLSYDITMINEFLNKEVTDKKLKNRKEK